MNKRTFRLKAADLLTKDHPLEHPLYKHVESEKDADAVSWAFVNHTKMVQYPFKFQAVRPHEVRVAVTWSGICHTDCSLAEEHWQDNEQWPLTCGHEVIGHVVAVGSDVKDLQIGDVVGYGGRRENCEKCEYCQKGYDNLCQGDVEQTDPIGKYWGGFGTHIQQPAQWIFKIPKELPEDRAPPIMCAGVTCYAPLARFAKPGDSVAVLGMGGLGHMGVMIAKAMGCKVTAFTSNEDKIDLVKNLPIPPDRVVVINEKNLEEEKGQYHVVLDTITNAPDYFDGLLGLTRPLGTFALVGLPAKDNAIKISGMTMIFGQLNFVGSLYGSRQEVRDCLAFCAKHQILPVVEKHSFEDFPKAYASVRDGNPVFRAVVNVVDWAKDHLPSNKTA